MLPVAYPSPSSATDSDADTSTPPNPYAYPTVVVGTVYHALTAFYIYTQVTYTRGNFAFTIGLICSTALFALGIWTVLFGGSQGQFSKTTGADKHTGNFPFGNKESAKAVKKEYRKEEKEKRRSLQGSSSRAVRGSKDS